MIGNNKRKIVFFIPNSRWHNRRPWISMPHGISILSSILKSKYSLGLIDANGLNLDEATCKLRLSEIKPDVVLMSGITALGYQTQIHYSMELLKSVCPDTITVLGGCYPTVMPEEAVEDNNIDYIFLGHAEERILDFLAFVFKNDEKKLKGFPGIGFWDTELKKKIINPVSSFISNVKSMVKPDYSLLNLEPYLNDEFHIGNTQSWSVNKTVSILTSYGCPYNCIFCATRTINGRGIAFRPLEDVFDEIDYFVNQYNVKIVSLDDDNFLLDRDRVIRFCEEFNKERWPGVTWKTAGLATWLIDDELLRIIKEAGCFEIRLAIESGSERVLKEVIRKPLRSLRNIPDIVKKCKQLGILVRGQFVIGLPGETWEEIRQTFRFAEKCDFDLSHFSIATPLPKTDLYLIAKKKKYLPEDFNFSESKFSGWGTGFITTDEFTPFELGVLRAFEWDRINFKTAEKIETAARMYNMTTEQLNKHRKLTRIKCGAVG